MTTPIKITMQKEMGDIKRSPVLNKKNTSLRKSVLVYTFIIMALIATNIYSFIELGKKQEIYSLINSNFEESYSLNLSEALAEDISTTNIIKIKNIIDQIKIILGNSRTNKTSINQFTNGDVQWFFKENNILATLKIKEEASKELTKFILSTEYEMKKEFNISKTAYRNNQIVKLMPSKDSRFSTPIYYTTNIPNYLIVSNGIDLIKNTIDKILD